MIIPSKKSTQEINRQLERICESAEFSTKKRLCELLRFLVKETVAGRDEALRGYQIGIKVFGRDKDFDPDYDPIVRIQAGRLRRSLYLYYLVDGKNDPIRIVIPKGGYKPKFFTAEEFRSIPDKDGIINNDAIRKIPSDLSIAVLPFNNLTGDPEKEYFAQGFTEELSLELTQYEDLTVIACRAKAYSDNNFENFQDLAKKIGVRFLIEGSVRLDRSKLTILIKLIDGMTNAQVWAERYQRKLTVDNLANIQEEIACETARILGSEYGILLERLSRESLQRKPDNLDTYDAILRYYYYEVHMSPELALEAFRALDLAIQKDASNGIANAMLASLHGNLYMLDRPGSVGAKEKMAELADKAIKLDPNSPAVNIIYAWKCFVCDEKQLFFETVNRCLTMKIPSPMRKGALGFHLSLYGEWESGKSLLDEAMSYNIGFPLYFHGATALYHYRVKDYDRALQEAKRYDMPALFWGPLLRTTVLGQLGRLDEAQQEINHLLSLKPDFDAKTHFLISRFVKEDQLVQHIIDGLSKAGICTKKETQHAFL